MDWLDTCNTIHNAKPLNITSHIVSIKQPSIIIEKMHLRTLKHQNSFTHNSTVFMEHTNLNIALAADTGLGDTIHIPVMYCSTQA